MWGQQPDNKNNKKNKKNNNNKQDNKKGNKGSEEEAKQPTPLVAAMAATAATLGISFIHRSIMRARFGAKLERVTKRLEVLGGINVRAMHGARSPAPASLPKPPIPQVKVAMCQLTVGEDKKRNIMKAKDAIKAAARNGARLVVLSETWNCPYANESFPVYAEPIYDTPKSDGTTPSTKMLSDTARECKVVLVGGSIPERDPKSGALYNTCCVYNEQGKLLGRHRKMHLFDIDIPGEITFKESDTLSPGDGVTVLDTSVGRIAIGICFDIRFPELAMIGAARGAHMLVYPGAFNTVTGPLHWELLQKARAVDNQVFVITCSPARVPGASYQAWGHSTVVGPFGEILSTCEEGEVTVRATLDMSELQKRRTNMPLESQRRGDIYVLQDLDAAVKEDK